MASDVLSVVRSWQGFIRLLGTHFKHQKLTKLFPAAAPLEFVPIVLLGPLKKTALKNTFLFGHNRLLYYNHKVHLALEYHGSHNDRRVSKVLDLRVRRPPVHSSRRREAVRCQVLLLRAKNIRGSKHYVTTAYHPQTSGKTERLNKTIVQRPRHYVADHQTSWGQ